MLTKERCPKCGLRVDPKVRICAACGYTLPPKTTTKPSPWGLIILLLSGLLGTGAVICWQLYREKRKWYKHQELEQQDKPRNLPEIIEEELMDF